ncbi:MAG: hypothetical protein AAGL98_13545, partial [Planctomycetota bacterium]
MNNEITASITNDSVVNTSGQFESGQGVLVSATDVSDIDVDVISVAASLAFSGGGAASVAVSVSIAEIEFNTETQALIEDSDVTAGSGNVELRALTDSDIDVRADAASISLSGSGGFALAGSGVGTIARVNSDGRTIASIRGGADVQALDGSVILDADDRSVVDADALGIAVSVSISGTLSAAGAVVFSEVDVDYGSNVVARIAASGVESEGDVIVTADSTVDSDAEANGISIGLTVGGLAGLSLSVAAGVVNNEVSQTVDASIMNSDDDDAVVAEESVRVEAEDAATLVGVARAISVSAAIGFGAGAIGVSAAVSNLRLSGATTARIGNSDVTALGGLVNVDARTTSDLT